MISNGSMLEHDNAREERADFFREDGYLILENAYSPSEVDDLRRDAAAICRGSYGSFHGLAPGALGESDDEVMRRHLCIHFPHKLSPLMANTITHPATVSALTSVIGPNVKCMQSMLFIKASGKPGQAWHQDEFFIPTRDRSLTGAWLALDDATTENGCLWVIPGSHKMGVIWPQHEHDDKNFDCSGESIGFPYSDEDAIPVPVKVGSLLFFNGYLLHRSLPNRAKTGYRRALVNHYMSAESLLPWTTTVDNDNVAVSDYRDIVMAAGIDPYAYKGIQDRAKPHVRPSGEGGCGSQTLNRPAEAANS